MWTYQCSVCFYICDLNLKVIENSNRTIIVFRTGKRLYHLPMEIFRNSPWNFWSNGKCPKLLTWVVTNNLFCCLLFIISLLVFIYEKIHSFQDVKRQRSGNAINIFLPTSCAAMLHSFASWKALEKMYYHQLQVANLI